MLLKDQLATGFNRSVKFVSISDDGRKPKCTSNEEILAELVEKELWSIHRGISTSKKYIENLRKPAEDITTEAEAIADAIERGKADIVNLSAQSKKSPKHIKILARASSIPERLIASIGHGLSYAAGFRMDIQDIADRERNLPYDLSPSIFSEALDTLIIIPCAALAFVYGVAKGFCRSHPGSIEKTVARWLTPKGEKPYTSLLEEKNGISQELERKRKKLQDRKISLSRVSAEIEPQIHRCEKHIATLEDKQGKIQQGDPRTLQEILAEYRRRSTGVTTPRFFVP
jgi:hypothetical protein